MNPIDSTLKKYLLRLVSYAKTWNAESILFEYDDGISMWSDDDLNITLETGHEKSVMMPFPYSMIEDDMKSLIEEKSRYYDDVSGYKVKIYCDTLVIEIYTEFRETKTVDTQSEERNTTDDSNLLEILDRFKEETDFSENAIIRIEFDGYGDSGYIEDYINIEDEGRDYSGSNPIVMGLFEDYCYTLLESYGGWGNNEGSYGGFVFNVRKGTMDFELNWREDVYETELDFRTQL